MAANALVPTPLAEEGARSLWRLTQIHVLDLQSAVAGDLSLEQKWRRNRVVARATRERPRKRHRAHPDATMR